MSPLYLYDGMSYAKVIVTVIELQIGLWSVVEEYCLNLTITVDCSNYTGLAYGTHVHSN